jgi:hypothetical protein
MPLLAKADDALTAHERTQLLAFVGTGERSTLAQAVLAQRRADLLDPLVAHLRQRLAGLRQGRPLALAEPGRAGRR